MVYATGESIPVRFNYACANRGGCRYAQVGTECTVSAYRPAAN